MRDQLTNQQTLRLSLLASVLARDALQMLNVDSMLAARLVVAQVIRAATSLDAELNKIKSEAKP